MLQKEQLLKSAGSWHRVAHCPWCTAGMALTSCCVLLGALAAPPPAASSGKQPAQRMPDLSLERLNLGLGFPVQESLCCRSWYLLCFLSLALCPLCQDLIIPQLCKAQVARQRDGAPAISTQVLFLLVRIPHHPEHLLIFPICF